ncbi:MAG: hypothetical protein COB15_12930 [Flavobacteriales bacterium]|nr:MAG: hypothetical protein COB15_12930 [Flavobacteriales bacterium]
MDTSLNDISLHFVGNKTLDHNLILSEDLLKIDDELADIITESFFERFATSFEEYSFTHASSLDFNEVYNFAKGIFKNNGDLHDFSKKIAQELYQQTNHLKIKDGELYIGIFSNCEYDGAYVDAIGIFKTEVKNDFLEVHSNNENFEIFHKQGIDLKKIEKGCIIYNTIPEQGYAVRIFDNQNRGTDAQYWKDDFLGLKPIANEYQQTNEFLGMTKEFISKQIENEFEVSKTDKIDLLNKSVEYFKTNDEFSKEEFEQEVFGDKEVIDSFRGFDDSYRETHDIEMEDNFEIDNQAVKKQARMFKKILKLDKNFHIYIHGDPNKIEKCVEADGRKYYKVYFDEEI